MDSPLLFQNHCCKKTGVREATGRPDERTLPLRLVIGGPIFFPSPEVVAQATSVGWLVVFALVHELIAPLIVSEDLVGEVEAGNKNAQAAPDTIGCLRVHLQVSQRPDIARGSVGPRLLGSAPAPGASDGAIQL